MEIKGFLETSFVDWDGKISSVLFLPFCNFRCPYCQNYKLFLEPEKIENVPYDVIEKFLIKNKNFIDGVCITGGEPTINKNIFELIDEIKKINLSIKLDTNGSNPEIIKKLIEKNFLDYIAMDLKGPINSSYEIFVGVKIDLEKIKESINIIMNSKIDYEFRTTVVPTLIDKENIEEIAKYIKGAKKFVLQQFNPKEAQQKDLRKIKPYDKNMFKEMLKIISKYVKNSKIRGI